MTTNAINIKQSHNMQSHFEEAYKCDMPLCCNIKANH